MENQKPFLALTGAPMMVFASLLIVAILAIMASPSWATPLFHQVSLILILSYSFISTARFLLFSTGAMLFNFKEKRRPGINQIKQFPLISIIMPAYNEEKLIEAALHSFSNINYPNFEIIVVDDGSTDKTFEKAEKSRSELPFSIQPFRKQNAGKAQALNYGIEKARGEFVLCMDADSILLPNSLLRGLLHFQENPRLGAVAGVVRVENLQQPIAHFQQLDYLVGHFQRKFLSLIGKVSIVPGPIGLFRKRAILSVGGYEKDKGTFAEDTELTFRLIAAGWNVECDNDMAAITEVPTDYTSLLRQRYRWSRGIYQALLKNLNKLTLSQHSSNIVFAIYLLWEQILIPVIDFAFLLAFVTIFSMGNPLGLISYLLLYVVMIDLLIATMAVSREPKPLKWVFVALISRFTYSNIILVWKLFAFIDEWKLVKMSWDKLSRAGFSNSTLAKEIA